MLVHGAWHGGWCWREVVAGLTAAGRRVFAPSLTGLADRRHLLAADVSLATHVQDIVGLIEVEDLERVVLVGHSYGGNVITGVADRLRERLAHCVYLDAIVPPDGVAQWRWCDHNTPIDRELRLHAIASAGGRVLPPPPAKAFGLFYRHQLDWVAARLTPMPAAAYTGAITLKNGGSRGLARTYIAAVDPVYAAMQPTHQRMRAEPGWRYQEIATGHDAMISAPQQLTEMLLAV